MADQNTLVLLHFNDNTTDDAGNSWTENGTFEYTNGKFGKALDTASSSRYLSTTASNDIINFPSSDFTVDWWWKLPSSGNVAIGNGSALVGGGRNNYIIDITSTGINFGVNYVVDDFSLNVTWSTYQDNEYHHIAIVRHENLYTLYIDGTSVATNTFSTNRQASSDFTLFGNPSQNYMIGYIDEFRISNIARWTNNFTPPVQEYDGICYAFLSNNSLYTGVFLTQLTNSWNTLTNAQKEDLIESFSNDIPSISNLISISPFRVLTNNTSLDNVKVTGQPKIQTITPTSLINTGAVSSLQSITVTNTITDTIVKIAITTDLSTYKVYDPTQSAWVSSTNIEEDGMSITQLNSLTPQILALLDVSNGIAFKQCFIATSASASAELSDISAVVNITGSWNQSVHGTDYIVTYPNKTTMSVRLLTNGDYIINYPISSNS